MKRKENIWKKERFVILHQVLESGLKHVKNLAKQAGFARFFQLGFDLRVLVNQISCAKPQGFPRAVQAMIKQSIRDGITTQDRMRLRSQTNHGPILE
ncbi:MAG: hypothetical protein LW710_06495 [Burkholderiales bacterium]|uniref:hypothetical protein n=1 Tax=Limnobacter sp. TaxID=2003368 RepID=UPI0039BC6A94|nr:hypothetical protein [Burkholderiales bacterium]